MEILYKSQNFVIKLFDDYFTLISEVNLSKKIQNINPKKAGD